MTPSTKAGHSSGWGTTIRVTLLLVAMYAAIYRPLPANFTGTPFDRFSMHVIEPVLRLTYYYPTRLCPDARCMLWWTRGTLGVLANLIGPMFDSDDQLHMETTHFDGVKVRVYSPRSAVPSSSSSSASNSTAASDGAVIFIHGGGFVIGNTEMYESLTRRMAKMVGAALFVSVDYRLAPETVFPGGLEDCERVVEYVMKNGRAHYGVNPAKIVIMGDSAGGNLAAAVTQRRAARDAKPALLGQVLLYPLLQFSELQSSSYRFFHRELQGLALVDPLSVGYYYMWYAGVDVVNHPEFAVAAVTNGHVDEKNKEYAKELLNYSSLPASFEDEDDGKHERMAAEVNVAAQTAIAPFLSNPDFAPLMRKNLTGLPSAMVVTCEFDVLRDEGALYAKRLADAGVRTNWVHYTNGFHAMLNFHNELQISTDALKEVVSWTQDLLSIA